MVIWARAAQGVIYRTRDGQFEHYTVLDLLLHGTVGHLVHTSVHVFGKLINSEFVLF